MILLRTSVIFFLMLMVPSQYGLAQQQKWESTEIFFVPPNKDGTGGDIEKQLSSLPKTIKLQNGAFGFSAFSLDESSVDAINSDLFKAIKTRMSASLKRMESVGFADPAIRGTVRIAEDGGSSYMPISFQNIENPARAGCFGNPIWDAPLYGLRRRSVLVDTDGAQFGIPKMRSLKPSNKKNFDAALAYYTGTLNHEFIHLLAYNAQREKCATDVRIPLWISEGVANGVGAYFVDQQDSNELKNGDYFWDIRDYSEPLDLRGILEPPFHSDVKEIKSKAYRTGSFFRYLIEANHGNGVDGLHIVKRLLDAYDRINFQSRVDTLKGLDLVIREETRISVVRGRRLFQVLPEFYTELGSHGFRRYTTPYSGMTDAWMAEHFGNCQFVQIGHGAQQSIKLTIKPYAARCIKLKWAKYKTKSAIQIAARGEGLKAIHLGESVRQANNETLTCYGATQKIVRRITAPMNQKCILKRGHATFKNRRNSESEIATWATDFGVSPSGQIFYVISNVPLNPEDANSIDLDITFGAPFIELPNKSALKPTLEDPTPDIKNGLVNVRKRVSVMSFGKDRLMIDGMPIFGGGEGINYLEGVPYAENATTGALIMGRNAMIVAVDPAGVSDAPDNRIYTLAPSAFSGGLGVTGLARISGKQEDEWYQCGGTPPSVSIEQTGSDITLTGDFDLIDSRKAFGLSGDVSDCDARKSMSAGRGEVIVSLPTPEHYTSISWTRLRSEEQDVYDEEDFYNGPNFGGIATSRSIIEDGPPDDLSFSPFNEGIGSDDGPNITLPDIPDYSGVVCDCGCPSFDRPAITPACILQCGEALAECRAPDLANAPGIMSEAEIESRIEEALKDQPPEIQELVRKAMEDGEHE